MSNPPTTPLPAHKLTFLQSCLSANALKFGTFTLKSGRTSPYFFNAGLFHEGHLLRSISTAFAETIHNSPLCRATGEAAAGLLVQSRVPVQSVLPGEVGFDILFGPAYKGIPLAATTLLKLCDRSEARYGALSYSFNRKEAKDHGEGGNIVGAPLKNKRVVIIDDVITAGTAIREAIEIIKVQGGKLVGIVVAFDRMERVGDGEAQRGSAIGEVRRQYGVPVLSILSLDDVVEFLRGLGGEEDLRRLQEYRERYQARD